MRRKLLQFVYILRNFSIREKVFLFMMTIIFFFSVVIALWKVSNFYSIEIPAQGGTINEGIVGTPRFINPLLAVSDADRDLTELVYSGLMRPDGNGGLMPDLAESYEISQDGLIYTFILKPGLVWQDNQSVTSDDIIFTIQQAKDSQLKSPKRASWEGVNVERVDDRTVRFVLNKPYIPFLENTVLGILPKHIWSGATADQMSFSAFNVNPIGSGPYKISKINRNSSGIVTSYELSPNEKFALAKPFIENLTLRFYQSQKEMLDAYQKGNIENLNAIDPSILEKIKRSDTSVKTLHLPRVFGVFFNQNNARLFTQKEVRQALNLSVDKQKIVSEVLLGFGEKLDYPIPPGTFGALREKSRQGGIDQAREILKKAGWNFNEESKVWEKTTGSGKSKETIQLTFSLATSDAADLKATAEILKTMWEQMGAKVDLKIFETGDLNQNIIRPRKYDALLFGEVVGLDPDPFAFWHSSQRNDPGLNIAMYTNADIDKMLEDARTTADDEKRKQIYGQFQKQIEEDTPAVFLFSPKFIYLMSGYIRGADDLKSIVIPSERFSQVYKWYIKTDRVWKIFAQ